MTSMKSYYVIGKDKINEGDILNLFLNFSSRYPKLSTHNLANQYGLGTCRIIRKFLGQFDIDIAHNLHFR
jgi:hypothetical protein